MHAKKVLVSTLDVNYAASKSSATQNTALNPADLAAGAFGVYGIHTTGSTNLNKLVLITDGGSEAAGAVPAASFVGSEVVIAIGKASGPSEVSQPIQVTSGLRSAKGAKYSAPVRGEYRIGYNGTSGSLNLPTLVKGDDFTINIINKADVVSGQRQPYIKKQLSTSVLANGESAYTLLKRWIAAVNLRTDEIYIDKATIKVLDNGTGAAFAASATVAAVNGATSLTTSAAHGVGVADYVRLDGDYYQAVTGTTGSTLVLDRPFQGPTGTIANANTLDLGATASTQLGLAFKDNADLLNLSIALQGTAIENATKTIQTSATIGSGGSKAQVTALEKEALGKKGSEDRITSYMPLDSIYSEIGAQTGFDLYFLEVKNSQQAGGDQGAVFDLKSYITLAFPQGIADSTNKNQSDFEDIMTSLFGASFPSISA